MPVILSGRNQEATLDEVEVVEQHFHTMEHWFGADATEESLTAYSADSGDGAFGTEVLVLDTDDTPRTAGNTLFDARRILINTLQHSTAYVIQVVWGTGTFAASLSAGQHGETMVIKSTATGAAGGQPLDFRLPRIDVANKLWIRVKNATNGSTVSFFLGIHEYVR